MAIVQLTRVDSTTCRVTRTDMYRVKDLGVGENRWAVMAAEDLLTRGDEVRLVDEVGRLLSRHRADQWDDAVEVWRTLGLLPRPQPPVGECQIPF